MMNYRLLAARAGLPAWMLLTQLAVAQETPTEEKPAEPEKTEEPATPEKTTPEETTPETPSPGTPALPEPKLPAPKSPTETTEKPGTDVREVEVPLDGIPITPGVPLPEGDPLLQAAGGAGALPLVGPEAPDPEIPGLLMDEPPTFGQGLDDNSDQGADLLNGQIALSDRDNDTEGLVFSIGVTESYSSNLEFEENDTLSVFSTTIAPGFSYRSAPNGGAENILAFSYDAGFDFYHTNQVDDSTNHRIASILTHNGAKLTTEFTGEYVQTTQASRFTEALSENSTTSAKVSLNYKFSPKTSFFATAEFSQTESSAGVSSTNDLFGASIGGHYVYSPKLSVGPSIRIADSSSDSTGSISSIAFGADVRYKPTTKIQLESTLGIESVDLPGGGSESSPTATFGINYRPDPIWSFTGEIRYEAIPINSRTSSTIGLLPGEDPLARLNGPSSDGDQQINATFGIYYTPGNDWRANATLTHRTSPSVINAGESMVDTSLGLGVSRSFGKSELSLRYSVSNTEFESSGVGGSRGDQEFQQFALSYSYPELFRGFDLNAGISYLENTGSRKYDETSVSISANYSF